jgi:hypothetical protein
MRERAYTNMAGRVRALGEAVTRTGSNDAGVLQMRQPILLAAPRILVSVSPKEGFLHQRTPLDSLGFDQPESSCRLE